MLRTFQMPLVELLLLICDKWAIILLAKDLLHPFHTSMDLIKILENLMLNCSLFLLEFE